MSKPKVLMVAFECLGNGGVQAVMMNYIRNLRSNYSFDMLLFTNEIRYYDREFLSYGGNIFRLPHYKGRNLRSKVDYYIRGFGLYFKIRKILQNNGPYHIIHCNNGFESALCLAAAKSVNVPIRICHSHGVYPSYRIAMKFLNSVYRFMINKCATHRLGCSRLACEALYGKKASSFIVNNPYDEMKFKLEHRKNETGKFILAHLGRYNDNKNQLFSLEILKELHKVKDNVYLYFIGFGDDKYIQLLKDKVSEYNLNEYVCFFDGNNANVPKLLSDSDAFLFPSKNEGFGIVLIEAQAMGLTCFVSDSVPRSTNVGGCIYMSLKDGADRWAKSIMENPCLKKKYDCSQFSTSKVIKQIGLIYGECL